MEDKDYIVLNGDIQQLVSTAQAWHYSIIPKNIINGTVCLLIDENKNPEDVKEELEILLGKNILLEKCPSAIIQKTLGIYYRKNKTNGENQKKTLSGYKSEDFVYNLIREAASFKSSDIHIEIYEEECRVRLRIDGKLIEKYKLKKEDYPALVNKIKIQANLDIAEKRLPQDGRIFFASEDEKFDIRVSILPSLYGEKIVLRLLSKDATSIDIHELGFSEEQLGDYFEGIKKPHGIILISGPTGSGKTTSLYATLKILNNPNTNILTIEDPIEYTLEGVNQVQLKEAIGLTFASALRTFLRQDPDIIMLGEIRDNETARMAIRAALTGHLVLSTIHT
ncbi:MAG: general secretion pathway protein GspE, partial [Bacteroidetes bacterium RIFOXYB2_FULL_35_7]